MTILRRIIRGEFSHQKYIPSIPDIMKEYGVMKDTASRAVTLLNSLGITKSIQKKGTIIVQDTVKIKKDNINFQDPLIQQRILYCMDALQLMTLSMHSSIPFDTALKQQLINDFERCIKTIPEHRLSILIVQVLMDFVIHAVPTHSLKNIFQQVNELLVWGYYLEAVDESYYADIKLTIKDIQKLVSALHECSDEDVPAILKQMFLQIYCNTYRVISKLPYDFGVLPLQL